MGDVAHTNYEWIISDKLMNFAERNYKEGIAMILTNQAYEKNFDGISPIKMALDNNQYSFIKILCERGVIGTFLTEYEDDIISYLLRYA